MKINFALILCDEMGIARTFFGKQNVTSKPKRHRSHQAWSDLKSSLSDFGSFIQNDIRI